MRAADLRTPRAFPGPKPESGEHEGMVPSLCETLLLHIRRKYALQKTAAEAWGVSSPFVSKVLHGRALPTKVMLDDAGIVLTKSSVVKVHWGMRA